jgi:DNA-binding transcriptional MocR family regulator
MSSSNSGQTLGQALRRLAAAAAPGTQLPSVRELVAQHRVSPVTVHRVLHALSLEGILMTRPGAGTFVASHPAPRREGRFDWQAISLGPQRVDATSLAPLASAPAGALALSCGYLDAQLQPLSLLATAMARAARRPGTWSRLRPEGIEALRAWFAREIGGGARESDVVIVSGGQAALTLAFRALSTPGAPIVFEAPTYLGALAAARAAGLVPVPVPCDSEGVLPDALERVLAATKARLVYCQPTYANPTGVSLAADRRARVLAALASADAFLIEDDSFRALSLEGVPPRPLFADALDGHVVYIHSLTKSVAPGLRVAAICARGAAVSRLRSIRELDDFFVAGALQEAALELVTSSSWPRHLASTRRALRERRDALIEALNGLPLASPISVPKGGFHVWLRLHQDLDDVRVAERAQAVGVVVSSGTAWFPAEAPGPYLRVSFGGADVGVLREGATRLKGVIGRKAPGHRGGSKR